MTIYEYKCPEHGPFIHDFRLGEQPDRVRCRWAESVGAEECQLLAKRVFSFHTAAVVHEHRDFTTGAVISDHRHRRDALKRLSDEHSARLGFDNTYTEVDLTGEPPTTTARPPKLTDDKELRARLAGEISRAL